jgi:hypothetical protein
MRETAAALRYYLALPTAFYIGKEVFEIIDFRARKI